MWVERFDCPGAAGYVIVVALIAVWACAFAICKAPRIGEGRAAMVDEVAQASG